MLLIASLSQKPSIRNREMLGTAIVCLFFEGIPPMLKLLRSIEHYRFIYYHWIIIIVQSWHCFRWHGRQFVSFVISVIYCVVLGALLIIILTERLCQVLQRLTFKSSKMPFMPRRALHNRPTIFCWNFRRIRD